MNVFYGFLIVIGIIFLFLAYVAIKSAERFDEDSTRGFVIITTVLALFMVVCTTLGDQKYHQKRLDAQRELYERNIIDGTYRIGHNDRRIIIEGDTTYSQSESFVILN